MKILLLSLVLLSVVGCETVKVAQQDFHNFRKTVELNSKMPAVYKHNVF
jgi:hypothetical protein